MTEEAKQAVSRWTEIGSRVVLAIILGLSAWTLSSLSEVRADIAVLKERTGTMQRGLQGMVTLEERVRQIEANRFTEANGERLKDLIDALRTDLAETKGRLPDKFPPTPTEKRIEKIEAMLQAIDGRLHDVEKK